MSIRKLSDKIQSLICSSNLNTYTKAVEELVYNSLDSKATSIAIRIHIEENKIQVVDNGCGINEQDFKLLGQRYTTSKYVDISTFKSAPNTYGFRGQSLANIIEVSEYVKITSRLQNDDKTWAKTYQNGKPKELLVTTARPSKGTTVEICGFLFNLNIQNKSINVLQEKTDIKTFLKQLSLVHNNVSLSLRDDSRNEIIFKMHKHKDIYPILKLLFDIDKINIQELKVEKNEYKAFAFIEKSNNYKPYHWIFLNKRFISNCRLHQLIKYNFSKYICQSHNKKKIKLKNVENIQDYNSIKEDVPFYVIFISCPYYDYDIIYKPKFIVEFKNWTPINKLIEKLVGFFSGGIKVKEIKNTDYEQANQNGQTEIRDQVREIMNKILGSHSKKVGISQIQNGIKGKLIKRKKKSPTAYFGKELNNDIDKNQLSYKKAKSNIASDKIEERANSIKAKKASNMNKSMKKVPKHNLKDSIKIKTKHSKRTNSEYGKKKKQQSKAINVNKDQDNYLKTKSNIIVEDAQHLIDCERMEIKSVDEIEKCANITENCNNVSVFKTPQEYFTHNLIPFSPKMKNNDRHTKWNTEVNFFSSRDLIKTILGTQEDIQCHTPNARKLINNNYGKDLVPRTHIYDENILMTFQSHCYNRIDIDNYLVNNKKNLANNWIKNNINKHVKELTNRKLYNKFKKLNFISKQSTEHFVIPKTYKSPPHRKIHKSKFKTATNQSKKFKNKTYSKITRYKDLNSTFSYTIENSKTVENCPKFQEKYVSISRSNKLGSNNEFCENFQFTYTITSSNITVINDEVSKNYEYRNIAQTENCKQTIEKNVTHDINPGNVVFISNSQNSNSQIGKDRVNGISDKNNIPDSEEHSRVLRLTDSNSLRTQIIQLINEGNKGSSTNNNFKENDQAQNLDYIDSDTKIVDTFTRHIIVDSSSFTIDPLNICQTIINNSNMVNDASEKSCALNNSCCSNSLAPNKSICLISTTTPRNLPNNDVSPILQNTCVTFNKKSQTKTLCSDFKKHGDGDNIIMRGDEESRDIVMQSCHFDSKQVLNNLQAKDATCTDTFNLKNRFRFVPKGMSPIFEASKTKIIFDKNTEQPYFENELYDKFINDIQTNTEIYEAKVQNPKDATTTAIEKVNSRLDKDNSSLTFDKQSLAEAIVLSQVDNKFIATILTGKSDRVNYLVLFDQHAVHERIRLENNLSDYFNGSEWKSIKLDELIMKLSEDEILYLHNYKEKFTRFGLNWTILDRREIRISSIPAAILGQNPREVDKVMKAVKNLITEEIQNIAFQRGCVSLYPKAIMDLVFSEACRYAIKFGDILSKRECVELMKSLSACKTPFQCAHGRPVMAIMLDIQSETRKYEFNPINLWKFKVNSC